MTLLVRDEEDILEANIDFHLAQGVNFIIATDNRSVDSTQDILRSYEARGVLHYLFEDRDDYNQQAWVTRMARMAHSEFAADWVINNDADEFWWPLEGDLRQTFASLDRDTNVLSADRHDFVATGDPSVPFQQRMRFRKRVSLNALGRPLPPKVAHRGTDSVVVAQGNHAVSNLGAQTAASERVEILHFPVRSQRQIENKIRKGGAAYLRNREVNEKVGSTWRALHRELRADSNLTRYFDSQYYDENRLAAALERGEVLEDNRLRDFLASRV